MNQLDEKIARFKLEKQESERIQQYLAQLNKSIAKAEKEIEDLKDRYIDELDDIQKIEDSSFRNVFQKILGSGEQALEHERQEALWAYMSLEKAHKSLELLRYEKSILIKKLLNFEYDDKKLGKLLKEKEEYLLQFPQMRIKLKLVDHEIGRLENENKEIGEVLDVSKTLIKQFEELAKELKLISNWNQALGNYYGKGHYSSYKKKMYVKRNLELLPKIEILNQKLNLELQDLKVKYDLDFTNNLTLLNNFFVLFLDNLITDWIVRNGIQASLQTVEIGHSKLNRMIMMLQHELEQIKKKLLLAREDREEVILKEKGGS